MKTNPYFLTGFICAIAFTYLAVIQQPKRCSPSIYVTRGDTHKCVSRVAIQGPTLPTTPTQD